MAANTRSTCVVLAMAALLTAVPARAQQAPQPVFRSGTSLVEVTVIVRDRDGRFVRDLTADDFEVREGDAVRRVETLYLVERPAAAGGAAPAGGVAAGAPGAAAPRTFVFLFDLEHLSPGGLTRAREAVEKFGAERLLPSDLSGIAALGGDQRGRISGDHQATTNAASELRPRSDRLSRERELREWPRIVSPLEAAAIAREDQRAFETARDRACQERFRRIVPCGAEGELDLAIEGNLNEIEQELRRKARMYLSESRAAAERSIGALAQMAGVLEALAGRKTIVWFTEGTWPEEIAERARQSAFRASQSGVAVYTIDPRGLGRQAERSMETAPAEVGLAFLQDMDDLSNLMAVGTGGLFIRSENNLGRALATVEDDTSTYYVLGYAAAAGEDRSTYRQLSVRLRREGLSARVRHGFMAPQRVTASPGSMVATAMTPVPGADTALPLPGTASVPLARPMTTAPTTPPDPTSPPSTVPTVPTSTHVPTTAVNVGRLRDMSGASASDLAARGWAAYEKGDLEAALPLLEQAAARDDVRPWALYALGFTYVGHGRPKDAIAAWERVRAAAPEFAPVYLDLAATYAQLSDVTEALAVLREAAARWPDNPDGHNGIGVLLVRRGAISEAIDAFTKATTAAPDDPLSWLNLGRAYELRYDRARRYDEQLQKWTGPEADRVKAEQSYKRCVALGGPYASQAAEALARMAWS